MLPQYKNMATKKEISEEINAMLGTDIDWSRLLEDDLKEFQTLLMGRDLLEILFKKQAKDMTQKELERLVDEWYPGKYARLVL